MKAANKVLALVGGIFTFVGCFIFIVFLANIEVFGVMSFFPLLFVVLGIAFIVPGILQSRRNKMIIRNGRKFLAKIYGYVEDTSVMLNGTYFCKYDRNGDSCGHMPFVRSTLLRNERICIDLPVLREKY